MVSFIKYEKEVPESLSSPFSSKDKPRKSVLAYKSTLHVAGKSSNCPIEVLDEQLEKHKILMEPYRE